MSAVTGLRGTVHGLAFAAALALTGCSPGAETSTGAGETADAADTAGGPASAGLDATIAELEAAVAAAEAEVERLKSIDEIENISSAYGHYVDESQHDHVADLFADDGVVEILGRGVFFGQERVREYMNHLPPPMDGSLFNHMHIQPVVHVSEDGQRARARSRLFVMFGIFETNAQWGAGVYENEFVKRDGVWQLDYLHAYQTFYTNYEDGWAERPSAIFAPYEDLPPDAPQSVDYAPYPAAFVPPFHYTNPVSGRDAHFGRPRPAAPAP